jgi:hypothetical protein
MIPAAKKKAGRQPHKRVTEDGITFGSETERAFYRVLKLWRSSGRITVIEPHPEFPIQAKFTNARGIKRRARKHTPDFRVTLADGSERIFEVKGADRKKGVVVGPWVAPDYRLRRDAVELQYGIAIWTVYPDGGQWIDADTKLPVVWP